jgi:hypothetical protein
MGSKSKGTAKAAKALSKKAAEAIEALSDPKVADEAEALLEGQGKFREAVSEAKSNVRAAAADRELTEGRDVLADLIGGQKAAKAAEAEKFKVMRPAEAQDSLDEVLDPVAVKPKAAQMLDADEAAKLEFTPVDSAGPAKVTKASRTPNAMPIEDTPVEAKPSTWDKTKAMATSNKGKLAAGAAAVAGGAAIVDALGTRQGGEPPAGEPPMAEPATPTPVETGKKDDKPKYDDAPKPPKLTFQPAKAKLDSVVVPSVDDPEYNRKMAVDVDGERVEMTPLEAQQRWAEMEALEIARKESEYRAETDAARAGALWAEIIRGVAALAAGAYGIKNGVDMSGAKFDPIDWVARQEAARRGHETSIASTKDKYAALATVAKAYDVGNKDRYAQALQRTDTILRKNSAAVTETAAANDAELNKQRSALDAWGIQTKIWESKNQLDLGYEQLRAKGDSAAGRVPELREKMMKALQAMSEAEAKGSDSVANAYRQTAFGYAQEIKSIFGAAGLETTVADPTTWKTKEKHWFGEDTVRDKTSDEILQSLPGQLPSNEPAEPSSAVAPASKRHNRDPNNKRTQYLDAQGNVLREVDGWQ